MSHIHGIGSELSLDCKKSECRTQADKHRFEGMLGQISALPVVVTSESLLVPSISPTEICAPFDCQSVMEQIVLCSSDCGSELSLQWTTDELGSLHIDIRCDGERIDVTIFTDDIAGAQALERHAEVLGDLLAEEGMHLARLTVAVGVGLRRPFDSERNDSESEINSLLGVIRGVSSS